MKPVYAEIVHDALKESGINFVAYLPDDQIHDAQKLLTEDPSFITVGATNEAEAVSACAGAWLGGAKPALLIADSGFLVATWPLASLAVSYGIPMLILIAHRGEVGDRANWRFITSIARQLLCDQRADRWAAAFDKPPGLVHRSTPSRYYSSADRLLRTTSSPSPPSTLKFDCSNLRPTGETG